ncbi:uncharacterized protein LAESUDRAFT_557241 [Laetiporus sulphureus 93-53]|uniref:Uncharacterized protein n=1 Tax=Laetiporus sulphureus 93-53 TaxID=1314785 RepID=A0A165B752_9APHY|nr:uncharacterized protein LAESUDRAFT_557241 [Laetiporus sulphureus 93-53]KZT00400.1 hypothetical protein LAESUDRAFT_557241 [Laetiporus sulphureus 93-53]
MPIVLVELGTLRRPSSSLWHPLQQPERRNRTRASASTHAPASRARTCKFSVSHPISGSKPLHSILAPERHPLLELEPVLGNNCQHGKRVGRIRRDVHADSQHCTAFTIPSPTDQKWRSLVLSGLLVVKKISIALYAPSVTGGASAPTQPRTNTHPSRIVNKCT